MAGEVYNIQPGVVRRMREVFGMQVIQAVNEGDAELAVEYYHEAAKLPQTKTENVFLEEGISMSSGKFFNLGVLNICFRSFKPYILKTLTEKELGRGEKFLESMGSYEYWQHYITEFDILANKFMLMPYYAATLVSIKRFDAKESSILMSQIGSALVFLHSRGFCFMDVKPSNICLAGDGSLVLIDLGSIAQIDTYTEVTTVYLPKDLQNEFICFSRSNRYQSSPLYDWWMLLVTLLEKSMDVQIGGLLPTPSRSDILERLSSASQIQVQREVLSELRQVIPTEMPFFQEPTEDTMPGRKFRISTVYYMKLT